MEKESLLGYLFGLLTSLCWAISPIFINLGLQEFNSSIWGTAIGVSTAALIYLIWLLINRKKFTIKESSSSALRWQILGGVMSGLGIMSRNIALSTAPVAIVLSLASIPSLFTLFLGPLLAGSDFRERISLKLILGILTIIVGSALVITGRTGI